MTELIVTGEIQYASDYYQVVKADPLEYVRREIAEYPAPVILKKEVLEIIKRYESDN